MLTGIVHQLAKLGAVVMVSSTLWLGPAATQATAQVNGPAERLSFTIQAHGIRGYKQLVSLAEQQVRQRVGEAFEANLELNEVRVVALVERNGSILPLITFQISRAAWQDEQAFPQTGYSGVARGLLNFEPSRPPRQVIARARTVIQDLDALENDPGFRDD